MMQRRLIYKTTSTLLAWLPLVMLAGSFLMYVVLRNHVQHMQRQQLQHKADNVWQAFLETEGAMPRSISGEYAITLAEQNAQPVDLTLMDTIFRKEVGGEREFARLSTLKLANGRTYKVETFVSAKESMHLMIKIALTEALIFIILLISIVVINKAEAGRIWAPFFRTLAGLRSYDVRKGELPDLAPETGLVEFNDLNGTLTNLFQEVDRAYKNQKQFTENAAHELQTPLAVIRSKVELLAESMPLNDESAQLLSDISSANDRMSQLNKNLLLLAKIENHQFRAGDSVDMSAILDKLVRLHEELHEHDGIALSCSIEPGVRVIANEHLIEVMLNNLIMNAFVHNVKGGHVQVILNANGLDLQNSGPAWKGDPRELFERFRKGDEGTGNTGLGLALVQQICQMHHYPITYTQEGGLHRIQVGFTPHNS